MIYEFSDNIKSIEVEEIKDSFLTVGYISQAEFDNMKINIAQSAATKNDFSDNLFRTKTDIYDDYIFCSLKIIEPDIDNPAETLLALYIKKNLIFIIDIKDAEHNSKNAFESIIKRFN
ncbi:MAG: hypothetical protein PUB20_06470, partial [Clostridia bacterium]|nr:hypothetical protein [Clostridia bacterium]